MVNTAIILAGGYGRRIRSMVSDVPKPMAPCNGAPFLASLMGHWVNQGIDNIILSVGYKADSIKNYFSNSFEGAAIEYIHDEVIDGTGKAIDNIIKNLDARLLILNGDSFSDVDLRKMDRQHGLSSAFATVATVERYDPIARYGHLKLDRLGRILEIKKCCNKTSMQKINIGVCLIESKMWNTASTLLNSGDSFEKLLLIKAEKMGFSNYCYAHNGSFIDIGLPEDFIQLEAFMKRIQT